MRSFLKQYCQGPFGDSTEDRRIGLNMNYSIIFKEICFTPENSILLQIIQIIHMTIGIMPESDRKREGSLSVLAPWRQTQCVTPTDKNPSGESHSGDLLLPPPAFFREERRPQDSPKKNPAKMKRDYNLARRRRS